jgi:hypothetical protein
MNSGSASEKFQGKDRRLLYKTRVNLDKLWTISYLDRLWTCQEDENYMQFWSQTFSTKQNFYLQ